MLLCRLRRVPLKMPGGTKCYKVPSVTAHEGCFTILRKPKRLEMDLAALKEAGYKVTCSYTVQEAAALDEDDPELYICVTLPRDLDEVLLTLQRMKQQGGNLYR
jgi:hypothetical protein